jgi:type II secretory pathway component GspD/PulD (secretin)
LIESFTSPPVAGSSAPPPKTTRQVQGVVTVPDNQLVIIGGLTNEKEDETVNKVPFLGDLPILGALFRSTSVMKRRTNVYIFITPHIVDEQGFDTLREISQIQLRKALMEGGKTESVGQLLPDRAYEEFRDRFEKESYQEMRRALNELFGQDFRRVRVRD